VSLFASPKKRNPLVCLLLAVITLALYNPVNHHPFVNYDDDRYVTGNPHVRQGLTLDTIRWSLTSTEQANWHPLTWMSHALDCSLFGLNPAGHHFTSVLIHTINVVLLYLLLIWSTGRLGPSIFVAALFAVHPLNVESVAWVAERKNLLCTLFFFLTLWAYGWYAQNPGWRRYLAVTVVFAMALAAKPMVITLPFVLLLLDYWPLKRDESPGVSNSPPIRWPALVPEKLPLLILSLASAVITMRAQRAGGAVRSITQFSLGVRVANAVTAYSTYLWKAVWPARLAPLYPHPGDSLSFRRILLAALTLIAISVLVFRFRGCRYLPVGWLWFLGTLVPVIGLVQIGDAAMADRYAYIPLIGMFVMISFGIADCAQKKQTKALLAVPAVLALLALAATTYRQIGYWKTSEDLWSHALAVTRNNFIAEDNLGGALILEGKDEQAYPHFAAGARINPRDPMSRSNLGTYFQTHNQTGEAVAEYEAAVQLTSDPGLRARTYANLGAAQFALGEDEKSQMSFEQSLRLNPHLSAPWFGLGLLARKQGKLQEAIDYMQYSINVQPTAGAYFELGQTFVQAGQIDMARGAYRQALRIDPAFTQAQQAADTLPPSKP
jgi:protein O-mannosyl-transferase